MDATMREAIARFAQDVINVRTAKFVDETIQNRNAPMHEHILIAFEEKLAALGLSIDSTLRISSWVHGLNTSMGTFFEKTGGVLSGGIKRPFTKKKKTSLQVSTSQLTTIKDIWNDLKSGSVKPNPEEEMTRILQSPPTEMQKAADFTADIFVERPDEIIAIEMKSVRPNKGESGGEKDKILEAKTALYNTFPQKKITFFVGYPFDPTSDTPTGYDKDRFMNYLIGGKNYVAHEEFMIGSELWNFLSGEENTMEQIIEILENVARKNR